MGIEYSTLVTAMCRNGTEFGIRVSSLGDEWFTAPSPMVDGLYVTGYSEKDAGTDMGDSAITETVGWGGFVIGGAPGILSLVGGTPEQALAYTREMRKSPSPPIPPTACPLSGLPVHQLVSISARWCRPVSPLSSIPPLRIRIPDIPRSVQAWCAHRWNASRKP